MADAARRYDVVLYGASGFTGRQAAAYFAAHAGALRWALAGRNRQKLEEVRARIGPGAASAGVIVADSADAAAIDAMVAQTRVVLNTAGPFAVHGDLVVDACVRLRAHYVDLTGETLWVRRLIDRHHAQAAADGTRIVPCCGFDSVPSDIGALLMVRHVQRTLGAECRMLKAYFRMRGGWNGGTLASAMHALGERDVRRMQDPFLLDPPPAHSRAEVERNRDPADAGYDADAGTWVGPFFMGPVNTRVVRRSAALLGEAGESYGPHFTYQEFLPFDPPLAHLKASAAATAMDVFDFALRRAPLRAAAQPLLPRPGTGPSEIAMARGWLKVDFVATTDDGRVVRGSLRDSGDPGNRVTVKCICEAALALVENARALPGAPRRGGVLTPATAFGEVLAGRLRRAGMTIDIGTA